MSQQSSEVKVQTQNTSDGFQSGDHKLDLFLENLSQSKKDLIDLLKTYRCKNHLQCPFEVNITNYNVIAAENKDYSQLEVDTDALLTKILSEQTIQMNQPCLLGPEEQQVIADVAKALGLEKDLNKTSVQWYLNRDPLHLMPFEFHQVKYRDELTMTKDEKFLFSYPELEQNLKVVVKDEASGTLNSRKQLLREYAGVYIDYLDYTHSCITGSAIPAVLSGPLRSYNEQDKIAIFYPNVTTVVSEDDRKRLSKMTTKRKVIHDGEKYIFDPEGCNIPFHIKDGADVDIAIQTETVEEFKTIAEDHIAVIKCMNRGIKLDVKFSPGNSPFNKGKYRINAIDPMDKLMFRQVEIYASSIGNLFKHHVAPVRGFYDGNFHITASCLYALQTSNCVGTYMIKSRKYFVQDILLKYCQRGFRFNKELSYALCKYVQAANIVTSYCPTIRGRKNLYNLLEVHRERPGMFTITPGNKVKKLIKLMEQDFE